MVASLTAQRTHQPGAITPLKQEQTRVELQQQLLGTATISRHFTHSPMHLALHRAAHQVSRACRSALLEPSSRAYVGSLSPQSFADICRHLSVSKPEAKPPSQRGNRSFCLAEDLGSMENQEVIDNAEPAVAHAETSTGNGSENGSVEKESRLVLGIETSCDETGAAVVSTDGRILGEALASSAAIHAQWGGVVPALAKGEHEKAIDGVVDLALSNAGVSASDLTAIAVTIGPGLSLCLRIGAMKARELARQHRKPLISVHHMEAHALVARLTNEGVEFPFLTLLVSGGHNLLLLAHSVGRYTQLGTTLDDALGEAYDKTARLLGLDLSKGGGPALEALAREGDPQRFKFSVPMRASKTGSKTCDFSYAGLKTNVRLAIESEVPGAEQRPIADVDATERQKRADIAASFQRVAVAHLEERTRRAIGWALEQEPNIKSLVLAGGVAANKYVRESLTRAVQEGPLELTRREIKQGVKRKEYTPIRLVCPPPRLCTDNGVMVAWAGVERLRLGLEEPPPAVEETDHSNVQLRPRWPMGDIHSKSTTGVGSIRATRAFPSLTAFTKGMSTSAQPAASVT